jgi:hypothetical protein
MREIKFRAVRFFKDGTCDMDYSKHWKSLGEFISFLEVNYPNNKLLAYTGLRDKNGTDIYEGDIIRDDDGFLWEVYFEDGMYRAKGGEFELRECLIEFCPEWCEVIGNIYEHPFLLEAGE